MSKSNIVIATSIETFVGKSDEKGNFKIPITLESGLNIIKISSIDQENNQKESDRFVILSQELAQKTLKANPHQVNFYRQQSQTYYLLSSLDQKYQESAYRLLLEAHRLAPVNPRITYNLGILVHQQGNLNQAINWLETTIRLKPDYQDGYYWLAKFYQENGQTDKAKERLKFLIGNLNPEHPEGRAFWEKLAE